MEAVMDIENADEAIGLPWNWNTRRTTTILSKR